MRGYLLAIALIAPLVAQQCPQSEPQPGEKSAVLTFGGRLMYHDWIREWYELKLDQPQCGKASIQLVRGGDDWKPFEALRGCRVQSRGALDFAPTGYYSLDIYQDVIEIKAVGSCVRQPSLPDYSQVKPDSKVRQYRVEMQVNYRPGDHPILFTVSSGGKDLRPWQAYARYSLTGGFVLYGHCVDGFVVDEVFGTKEAKPSHFDDPRTPEDMAAFDPESAADLGKKDLLLGFTCVREK